MRLRSRAGKRASGEAENEGIIRTLQARGREMWREVCTLRRHDATAPDVTTFIPAPATSRTRAGRAA